MPELTDDQEALFNDALDKALDACQSVLDGLEEWSQEYDNGFGHACESCMEKIRALKIGSQKNWHDANFLIDI